MRLRHPSGFDEHAFGVFCTSAEIFAGYATALLRAWHRLPQRESDPHVEYVFFRSELSADRTIASLPIGGPSTLGTRAAIENSSSYFLWRYLPAEFMVDVEEGLTETLDPRQGPHTAWRRPMPSIRFANANLFDAGGPRR